MAESHLRLAATFKDGNHAYQANESPAELHQERRQIPLRNERDHDERRAAKVHEWIQVTVGPHLARADKKIRKIDRKYAKEAEHLN